MVNVYLFVKWLHVLSSVALVGIGFGSAYYMFFANRGASLAAKAEVARLVVRADWWFTAPAAVLQPVTGLLLAHLAGLPLSTPWLATSIALFLLAGACWIPVLWLQIELTAMAREALASGTELPDRYRRFVRWWELLGYPAFAAMLVVYWLMVVKPSLTL